MKKVTILLIAIVMCVTVSAQTQSNKDTVAVNHTIEKVVKDTTIQILLSMDQFKMLLYGIDANIDSKKASKDIIQFLQQSARILEADKPKDLVKPKK